MTRKAAWLSMTGMVVMLFWGCDGGGKAHEDVTEDDAVNDDAVEVEAEAEADTDDDGQVDPVEEDTVGDDVVEEDVVEEEAIELTWGPCDTSNWYPGYPTPAEGVECTTIEVPLDYENPGAGTITLNVGRHPARYDMGKALFNFAGGPGGSAVGQSGAVPVYMPSRARDDFDLIYVDQRGAGDSGYMYCPGGYPVTQAEWEACAALYTDVDLNHYLTLDAARDVDFVRQALGYDRIYIRGGSYGTRMGLEYMRQYPENVVAAVLDGLAPPDLDLIGEALHSFEHGLALLEEDCSADPTCLAVSPTLDADLVARREALRADPRPIIVGGHAMVEDEETYRMFLDAFLYTAGWRYRIPRAIHEAVGGDNTLWNGLMSEAYGTTVTDGARSAAPDAPSCRQAAPLQRSWWSRDYVAPGLLATVFCAEFMPNSPGIDAMIAEEATLTWASPGYLDMAKACAAWDVDPLDAALRQAVESDIPTLLMSGEIDLNTWAEWGDHTAETLSDGHHYVVPYATHSTLSVACAAQIITDFLLQDGNIDAVGTTCLGTLRPPAW
jgi:pimeloyl-ACP methyl ester carboxylesterase